MNITLFHFNKRKNSTKLPNVDGTVFDCQFKEQVELHHPVVTITNIDSTSWTYAQMGNIYYFISSITIVRNNLYHIAMDIDLLATYKSQILNTDAFVLYSDTMFNKHIPDSRIPITGENKISRTIVYVQDIDHIQGTYAFSTIGYGGDSYSAFSTTYLTESSTVLGVAQKLLAVDDPNILDDLSRMFNKPMEAVVGLKWMPIRLETAVSGLPTAEISLGKWYSGMAAWVSGKGLITKQGQIPIKWNYSNWLDLTPYTTVTVSVPFYGLVPIEASILYGSDHLNYSYTIDVVAGEFACSIDMVKNNLGYRVFQCNVPIGVDLPLGQTNTQIGSGLASVGAAILGGVTGNIPLAIGGISSAFMAGMSRSYSGTGGISGGKAQAQMTPSFECVVQTNVPSEEYLTTLGQPFCANTNLSVLSGYVQTSNASVRCSALNNEITIINDMLDAGIYIE